MARVRTKVSTSEPGEKTVTTPFTVVVDSRETIPYTFNNLRDNVKNGQVAKLIVPTVRAALRTGDYSIQGCEDLITIERKSKEDLWNSISQGRRNFVERLERMESFVFAAVVIEASWDDLLVQPQFTEYLPKSLSRTIQSWLIRYKCKWLTMPSRTYAEAITYRLLERFYILKQCE